MDIANETEGGSMETSVITTRTPRPSSDGIPSLISKDGVPTAPVVFAGEASDVVTPVAQAALDAHIIDHSTCICIS
jgi:hypothetical protein